MKSKLEESRIRSQGWQMSPCSHLDFHAVILLPWFRSPFYPTSKQCDAHSCVARWGRNLFHPCVLPISIRRQNGALALLSPSSLSIFIPILKRFSSVMVSTGYAMKCDFFSKRDISFSYQLIVLLIYVKECEQWGKIRLGDVDAAQNLICQNEHKCRIKQDSRGKNRKRNTKSKGEKNIIVHNTNLRMPEIFLVLYWKDLVFVGDGLYPFRFQILIRMLDHVSVAHIDHKNGHIFPSLIIIQHKLRD